ncbi:unnamed protein product [Amoebophrya sp. A25]|nr:unnamed protein product [Amoebophrya sp. A25]|eukprot:GSA25T00018633001.1
MPWHDLFPYEANRPKTPQLYPYKLSTLRSHVLLLFYRDMKKHFMDVTTGDLLSLVNHHIVILVNFYILLMSPQTYPRPSLSPQTYYHWCSCGRSNTQPWCDGKQHIGTGMEPVRFTVRDEGQMRRLCGCKYTSTPPFCNGITHTAVVAHRFPAWHYARMTPYWFAFGTAVAWFWHP